MKKYLKTILKVCVSIALISFILLKIDRASVLKSFETFNPIYIGVIVLLIVGNYVFSSIRWKQLLIYENTDSVSTKYLIGLYFMGSFFNNFMPTSIGGDVFKVLKLGKKIKSNANAFSATFMERFTGVISLVFLAFFGLIGTLLRGFSSDSNLFSYMIFSLIGLVILFVFGIYVGLQLLNFLRKKITKLDTIYTSLIAYKGKTKVLVIAFLTSFIVQIMTVFSQYFIFVALGYTPDVFRAFFIFPIIILASFFIPSLNGIGVQDILYKFSYVFLVIAEPAAVAASFIFHLFKLGVSLIGGVLYALGKAD